MIQKTATLMAILFMPPSSISTLLRCQRCDIDVCFEKCSQDKIHTEFECEIVAKRIGQVNTAVLLQSLLCLRFVLKVDIKSVFILR